VLKCINYIFFIKKKKKFDHIIKTLNDVIIMISIISKASSPLNNNNSNLSKFDVRCLGVPADVCNASSCYPTDKKYKTKYNNNYEMSIGEHYSAENVILKDYIIIIWVGIAVYRKVKPSDQTPPPGFISI